MADVITEIQYNPPSGKEDDIYLDISSWIRKGRLPHGLAFDFDQAWEQKPTERGTLMMHGTRVTIPCWNQSFLRPYFFSGKLHPPAPMSEVFVPLYEWSRSAFPSDHEFNQMLVNWYQDGNDYIGAHSDAERDILPDSSILSISFGQERTFRVRKKDASKTIVTDILMPDRSFVVMGGAMQSGYTHEVPKVNGQKGQRMKRRINVTFRSFQ